MLLLFVVAIVCFFFVTNGLLSVVCSPVVLFPVGYVLIIQFSFNNIVKFDIIQVEASCLFLHCNVHFYLYVFRLWIWGI